MKRKNNRKEKLLQLNPELLAETLLGLAAENDDIDILVERLTSTPKENLKRYKKSFATLSQESHEIDVCEDIALTQRIEKMIKDLEASRITPSEILDLLMKLNDIKDKLMDRCVDRDTLEYFYQDEFISHFVHHAKLCEDKEKVLTLVFTLASSHPQNTQRKVIKRLMPCLSPSMAQTLIVMIQGSVLKYLATQMPPGTAKRFLKRSKTQKDEE